MRSFRRSSPWTHRSVVVSTRSPGELPVCLTAMQGEPSAEHDPGIRECSVGTVWRLQSRILHASETTSRSAIARLSIAAVSASLTKPSLFKNVSQDVNTPHFEC